MTNIKKQHITDIIKQQGIKTGLAAMQSCGIQPEFAAHLILMSQGTNVSIVLRAGSTSNYDRPGAPKPGYIRSKSSKNQGFFNGYLAAENKFSRVEIHNNVRRTRGIHEQDAIKLQLPITNPEYLHSKQLTVNLYEINTQLGANGDLEIKNYDPITGQLQLKFKADKGSPDFHGTFIIKLSDEQAENFQQIFSRPWNKPTNPEQIHRELAEKLTTAIKAEPLINLSKLQNKDFKLYYTDTDNATAELKPAKVLCRTPKTFSELKTALIAVDHLLLSDRSLETLSYQQLLLTLGSTELEKIYNQQGQIITGDWDGLVLGHPLDLEAKYLKPYNTFISGNYNEITTLLDLTNELLTVLQEKATAKNIDQRTKFDNFILDLNFYEDILEFFALEHAGIITPFEFLYQQLSNYAYQQIANCAFGEQPFIIGLHETMDSTIKDLLNQNSIWNKESRAPNAAEITKIINSAKITLAELHKKHNNLHQTHKTKIEQHLIELLTKLLSEDDFKKLKKMAAQSTFNSSLLITHPDFDHNIGKLFQHGFDMHSPYGLEADSNWLMVTADGLILTGNNQQQLISVLMCDNAKLLSSSYFNINPHIDMRCHQETGLGWSDVIIQQLKLNQPVTEATMKSLVMFFQIQSFEKKYTITHAMEPNDAIILKNILATESEHKQIISDSLRIKFKKYSEQPEQRTINCLDTTRMYSIAILNTIQKSKENKESKENQDNSIHYTGAVLCQA
jgi:hypothetical protein